MAYVVNQSLLHSLTIGGADYTEQLVSFSVSDGSAYGNGIVSTAGSLTLATTLTRGGLSDYDRTKFKRGSVVLIDMAYENGEVERHPRGFLYVISNAYDPETEEMTIEVGCELVLRRITDDVDGILQFAPIALDPAQRTYEGLASSLAAAGKVLWCDRFGQLQTADYFTDTAGNVASPEFVSVKGVTTLNVSPLAGGKAIPDVINLSYQFPEDAVASDGTGREDVTTTVSTYYLRYPAPTFKRVPSPGSTLVTIARRPPTVSRATTVGTTTCGNAPPPPVTVPGSGSGVGVIDIPPTACSDALETVEDAVYLPARRTETQRTVYGAPGAQVSVSTSTIRGPKIEANSQYFADSYSYCRGLYATGCNPSGGCPTDGMDEMILAERVTRNTYGAANELIQTVQLEYRPVLSAAQTTDWRSGIVNGIPQDFNSSLKDNDSLYLYQKTTTNYRKEDNANVQETITLTSMAARGSGISNGVLKLDANKGVRRTEVRRSVTITTVEVRPDAVNAASTQVRTENSLLPLANVGGYTGPSFSGPYIIEESVPVPFLTNDRSEIQALKGAYELYISRWVEGDSRGLQIGEALRRGICRNWTPNTPMAYGDPVSDEAFLYRMDAATWAITSDGSAVAFSAIWIDDLAESITIPDNVEGNTAPNMDPNTPPPESETPPDGTPTDPQPEPGLDGPATPINRVYRWSVDVPIYLAANIEFAGGDGVRPIFSGKEDFEVRETMIAWCGGSITEPGALVDVSGGGTVLLTDRGSMVTDESKTVVADLFAN